MTSAVPAASSPPSGMAESSHLEPLRFPSGTKRINQSGTAPRHRRRRPARQDDRAGRARTRLRRADPRTQPAQPSPPISPPTRFIGDWDESAGAPATAPLHSGRGHAGERIRRCTQSRRHRSRWRRLVSHVALDRDRAGQAHAESRRSSPPACPCRASAPWHHARRSSPPRKNSAGRSCSRRDRNGYDGKGNATIREPGEIEDAWQKLGGGQERIVRRAMVPVHQGTGGDGHHRAGRPSVAYPVVETVQRDHICQPRARAGASREGSFAIAPPRSRNAPWPPSAGDRQLRRRDVTSLPMAPSRSTNWRRAFTTPAITPSKRANCSQFENHVRAVLGWPLGSTAMVAPAAVMVNLLGFSGKGPGRPAGYLEAGARRARRALSTSMASPSAPPAARWAI